MITKPLLAVEAELDKVKYPVIVSPKLDGIRCIIRDGVPLSRTFKPIRNKHITALLSGLPNGLDGELMLKRSGNEDNFQDISSAVMSADGKPNFIYCLFDYVRDSLATSYEDRLKDLNFVFKKIQKPYIKVLMYDFSEKEKDILKYEKDCLDAGFEGVMLRDPKGKYKCGRSTVKEGILLKLKRFSDSEARIIECVEKETNTNEKTRDAFGHAKRSSAKAGKVKAGTLGSFKVRDIKTGIEFSIGSGFDDSLRETVWRDRDSYVGKIIKYKYQPTGVKEAPRFPVFLGFRDEEDMSDD